MNDRLRERSLAVRRAMADEGRGRARRLYRDGYSISFIANLLGVSKVTVKRYLGGLYQKGKPGRPRKSQI